MVASHRVWEWLCFISHLWVSLLRIWATLHWSSDNRLNAIVVKLRAVKRNCDTFFLCVYPAPLVGQVLITFWLGDTKLVNSFDTCCSQELHPHMGTYPSNLEVHPPTHGWVFALVQTKSWHSPLALCTNRDQCLGELQETLPGSGHAEDELPSIVEWWDQSDKSPQHIVGHLGLETEEGWLWGCLRGEETWICLDSRMYKLCKQNKGPGSDWKFYDLLLRVTLLGVCHWGSSTILCEWLWISL